MNAFSPTMRFVALAFLFLSCAHAPPAAAVPRGREFWVALKDTKFALPAGTTRADVLRDAVELTGNADPVLRDDVGYGLAVQWVYREQALTPDELKTFTSSLVARLTSPDTLARSFSALSLSIIAAAETKKPQLDALTWNALVEAACVELESETDLRGHDAKLGWIHATAHTADLIKFLARDSRLTVTQQQRMLGALQKRLTRTEPLAWGEDERLASAFRSLLVRPDFDGTPLDAWLSELAPKWKTLWETPTLNRETYLQLNAIKQVLRALLLTLPDDSAPGKHVAQTLAALSG